MLRTLTRRQRQSNRSAPAERTILKESGVPERPFLNDHGVLSGYGRPEATTGLERAALARTPLEAKEVLATPLNPETGMENPLNADNMPEGDDARSRALFGGHMSERRSSLRNALSPWGLFESALQDVAKWLFKLLAAAVLVLMGAAFAAVREQSELSAGLVVIGLCLLLWLVYKVSTTVRLLRAPMPQIAQVTSATQKANVPNVGRARTSWSKPDRGPIYDSLAAKLNEGNDLHRKADLGHAMWVGDPWTTWATINPWIDEVSELLLSVSAAAQSLFDKAEPPTPKGLKDVVPGVQEQRWMRVKLDALRSILEEL